MKRLVKLYREWRLRRAQEAHAEWKGRREMLEQQLGQSLLYAANPYNRDRAVRAAGKESKYAERIEQLLRQ